MIKRNRLLTNLTVGVRDSQVCKLTTRWLTKWTRCTRSKS